MTTRHTLRLIRFGSAKSLTQAHLPFGDQESSDVTDRYGI